MIFVYDWGYRLNFVFKRPLASAIDAQVVIVRPGGTKLTLLLSRGDFVVDADAGTGYYTVKKGDVYEPGEYKVQASAVWAVEGKSSTVSGFSVAPVLVQPVEAP